MRIGVVSDIHGNLTAFEAVLADLWETSPDLIFHGGDLADSGSSPVEIVDRIRDLGWPGVIGNTDEMLSDAQTLADFAGGAPQLKPLFNVIEEMAAASRNALGNERLAWLGSLPRKQVHESMALIHASPESPWRSPVPEAPDSEFESVYGSLGQPVTVYGHIHRSFVRSFSGKTIINAGSVSLSYDGDPRASYLLLDDWNPTIRRVEYDVGKEIKALAASGFPHSAWVAKIIEKGCFQMP